MPSLERRVDRLERLSTLRASGKTLFAERLLDLIDQDMWDDIDVIEQGIDLDHEGPLGGRSVTIPLLFTDEAERTHQIMVTVYCDSRIDETFARAGWVVDE